MTELEGPVRRFAEALLALDRTRAKNILSSMTGELQLVEQVERIVVPAMEFIGAEWEKGTVALSQVYMSGRICEELMEAALPPGNQNRKPQPTMAIAVLQDYHMLGKKIVSSVVRAGGYELLDYGRVEPEELVLRVQKDNIKILLISTLMLPSALKIREVSAALREEAPQVRIIVGGAPFRFDDQLWKEVGADAVGANASEALKLIRDISGGVQ